MRHAARHWTTYERFFYRTRWSLELVSQLLMSRVVAPMLDVRAVGTSVDLILDDTTCGRYGRHVALAGYFKDASASNARGRVIHWSHLWIIGCLTMSDRRWPRWVIGLPVLFELYRKRPDSSKIHPFRTRQQIAARMVAQAQKALADRTIRVTADGQYATREMVAAVRQGKTNLVSRMRSDAALYELPSKHRKGRRGRERKKGRRLPTPREMARRRKKGWRKVWVQVHGRLVERLTLSIPCLWYHVAKDHAIKLLIVRDPEAKQKDDYLFCTDPTVADQEMIERQAGRWPIEECIRDGKQFGGFERVQGWCPRTVERQAPVALIVQTLVKVWYLRWGVNAYWNRRDEAQTCGWTRPKDHPSYLDMLSALRDVLWADRLKCNSTPMDRVWNLLEPLRAALRTAA